MGAFGSSQDDFVRPPWTKKLLFAEVRSCLRSSGPARPLPVEESLSSQEAPSPFLSHKPRTLLSHEPAAAALQKENLSSSVLKDNGRADALAEKEQGTCPSRLGGGWKSGRSRRGRERESSNFVDRAERASESFPSPSEWFSARGARTILDLRLDRWRGASRPSTQRFRP